MRAVQFAAFAAATSWLITFSACSCGGKDVRITDDAGENLVECTGDTDCPLGQGCVDGRCVVGGDPGTVDSGFLCAQDSECPSGMVCLKSEGLCITPAAEDAGEVDAGSGECFEGELRPCGQSKLGECRLGTETCGADNTWAACVGAVFPSSEGCDGKDNDCDGLVDNGFDKQSDISNCGTCGHVCSYPNATPLCQSGACVMGPCDPGHVDLNGDPSDGCEYACTVSNGGAEICDGADNDCNGQTDENIPALSCGVGACAKTVSGCQNGTPGFCTPGTPTSEVCDGADNDCDGQVDEGLPNLTCGRGECFRTVPACNGSAPNTCVPGTPTVEVCDTKDNDCDGTVDNGCACVNGAVQSCYSGSPGTAGKGVCVAGTQTCSNGQWGACVGEVTDSPEVCDNKDNDCDGVVNDGLPTLSCGQGSCARTVSSCINGQPNSTCTPGTPSAEVCDNADNDCNGQTDEGTQSCGVGACRVTVNKCSGGANATCTPGAPTTEVCDGVDNDCDGMTDESYPQQGQSCSTGLPGPCGTGTRSCSAGVLGCQQTVQPKPEICGNLIDDNCNGTVDDPTACGCDSSIDADLDGVNQCLDCNDTDGTIKPGAAERCNGRDDNCNNQIDEGFDTDNDTFTTCGTKPGGGIDIQRIDCNDSNAFIFPGKAADCGAAATPNTANGVDDNCNGYVDETCNCTSTDQDGDGVTKCQGDCNDSDPAIFPGKTEVCDGKDNDCDKDTIDNCDVSDPCGFKQGNSWNPWAAGTDTCKPSLICVSNVATGALTCGSFCNQTVGAGTKDSCASGQGCNRDLLDSDALHLCSVVTTGAKTTGQACTANTAAGDAECRSGDCFAEGGQTYCTDRCTHQSGCGATSTCTIQKVPLTSGPFVIGNDYSAYCRLNAVISGTKTTGQACTGAECKAGTEACFGGKCAEPCCSNSDCATGYGCSLNGPRANTGYTSGGVPVISAEPVCLQNASGKSQGQVCASSAECKSGICEKTLGVCMDLCCNDSTCTNGTTCELLSFGFNDGGISNVRACAKAPLPTVIQQK